MAEDAVRFLLDVNPNLKDPQLEIAIQFAQLAHWLEQRLGHATTGGQYDVGMQRLLEAKDAFVRSSLS